MWIESGCVHAKLAVATEDERRWLNAYLSFPDANARYKTGGDGKVHLFNDVVGSFPSGYTSMVVKAAKEEGYDARVIDQRVLPCPRDPEADLAWLWDYQRAALERLLLRERGIAALPTGAGKTELVVGLTRAVPCEWLLLAPAKDLVFQAADRFRLRNQEDGVDLGDPGVIAEGQWTEGEHLTVATFQTFARSLQKGDGRALRVLERVGGVVVDESHTLPAESFYAVAMRCRAYYRFGLSGTPLARGDRRSILSIAALGPVVYRLEAQALIDRGDLSRPRIRMATVTQTAPLPYDQAYEKLVVRSKTRNAKLVQLALRAAKPGLVFVEREAHGRTLEKLLINAGLRCSFIWGKHSTEWRRSHLRRLVSGYYDVLVCSSIFQQGIDVPELASIVNGAAGMSVIRTLQRLGRGMRVTATKDEFELFDVFDVGNEYLARHARVRRNAYAAQGYETVVEQGP